MSNEAMRYQIMSELGLVHWQLRADAQVCLPQAAVDQNEATLATAPIAEAVAEPATTVVVDAEVSANQEPTIAANPQQQDTSPAVSDDSVEVEQTEQDSSYEEAELPHLPCCISLPANADDQLRRIAADIMHVLQWHDRPYQRIDMEANAPLPEAPAVCFAHEFNAIQQDSEGRLLIPVQQVMLEPEVWKPQVWAYLQSQMVD